MTDHKNNPHKPGCPEWELFENAKDLEMRSSAYFADSTEFAEKAIACRQRAERFWDALRKLGAE